MPQPIGLQTFLSGPLPDRAAILADLDGCLIAGERVLPGVPELFARCRERLWIVSNNSSDTAQTLSRRLAGLGLELPAERIVLAGEQTLRMIRRRHPGARVALFAAAPIRALAREIGLVEDRENPELVFLGRDPDFDFSDLTALFAHVARRVPVWLSNPDPFHPGPDGLPRPETGAIWAAVRAALPDAVAASLGKPAADLAAIALAKAGVAPEQAVFIGDTPETDGGAAAAAGVDFVLLERPARARAEEEIAAC